MVRPKVRFLRRLLRGENARDRHCSCCSSDAARRYFCRLVDWAQESRNYGEDEDFLSDLVRIFKFVYFYQFFDEAFRLWSSPDSWRRLAIFHSQQCSHVRIDVPSGKESIHCELEHRRRRSQLVCEQCGHFSAPSIVSSARYSRPSFPSPLLSTWQNHYLSLLPSNAVVTKAINCTTRTSLCRSRELNVQIAVSRHLDKNRAKHRRPVLSTNKAKEADQQSTKWRRGHFGELEQQPLRLLGSDKNVDGIEFGRKYNLGHRDCRSCDTPILPVLN